jgi:hypothetical protein
MGQAGKARWKRLHPVAVAHPDLETLRYAGKHRSIQSLLLE